MAAVSHAALVRLGLMESEAMAEAWAAVMEMVTSEKMGEWDGASIAQAGGRPGGYLAMVDQGADEVRRDVRGTQVVIRQNRSLLMAPGVTGSVVWDGGAALPALVEELVDRGAVAALGDAAVWELGAGCGLAACGLLALGAKHVVATDQRDLLGVLEGNLRRNFGDAPERWTCGELDWDDAETDIARLLAMENAPPLPDLVVLSDTMFNENAARPLVSTLKALAKHGKRPLQALAVEEMRAADVLSAFLEEAQSAGIVLWRVNKANVAHAAIREHPRCVLLLMSIPPA